MMIFHFLATKSGMTTVRPGRRWNLLALELACLALLCAGCAGGAREINSDPEKTTPSKSSRRPAPGPPAAPGTAPELKVSEAGLLCMDPECFQARNFPALSTNGQTIVVFAVETVHMGIAGTFEPYKTTSVLFLDAKTGKLLKELPLVDGKDHFEAHHSVQDKECLAEVRDTGEGNSQLCREDPALVEKMEPHFQKIMSARVAAVTAELAQDRFEAMTPVSKAGAPAPAAPVGGLVYLADEECVRKVEVKDPTSGKVVSSFSVPATTAVCDNGPSFVGGVWRGGRSGVFLVSVVNVDRSEDQKLRYLTVSRAP